MVTVAGPEEFTGDLQWLQEQLQDQQLADRVNYVGTVGGSDKQDLLRRCDCLVLPSRAEGLPLTLLEAGANGPLCDCHRRRGDCGRGFGIANGRLLASDDADGLTAAMGELIHQPGLARQWGRLLGQTVRTGYSLDHQSALIADLYDDLLGTGSTSAIPVIDQTVAPSPGEPVALADGGWQMKADWVKRWIYPLHERLCGRRTFAYLRELNRTQWWSPDQLRGTATGETGLAAEPREPALPVLRPTIR